MDDLITQQAPYLVFVGVLGLALGWWIGRASSRKAVDRAVGESAEQLSSAESALEEATSEVQRLAGQVAELNIEVEESRDKAADLAGRLESAERQAADERERAGDLRSRIAARESEQAELSTEISRWRQEVDTLQQEQLVAQEDIRRLEDDLERERGQNAELEIAAGRYGRRIADLESALSARQREDEELRESYVALDDEVARLRQVKLEFQEWMQGAALSEEELRHARRQLEAAGDDRETVENELISLRSQLDEAGLQAEAHEAKAAELGSECRQLSEELDRAGNRIRELEGNEGLASRLAAEIEGLHTELAAAVEREQELEDRAQAAEAARAQATEELENVIHGQLLEVDRLAAARRGSAENEAGDSAAPSVEGSPDLLEAPRGAADDLKRIRGIGPVLERLLNRLGVYHYRQIASWTPAEISWVASHVNTFPDRIERDGWTSQAAQLDRERHGEAEEE